jgi:hypothetical protein
MDNVLFIGRASGVSDALLSSQTPVHIQGVDQAGIQDDTCMLMRTATPHSY